jgi:hypothetical protein
MGAQKSSWMSSDCQLYSLSGLLFMPKASSNLMLVFIY